MADPINFADLFNSLKDQIVDLAKLTVKDYLTEAKKDAQKLLQDMKQDLQKWTTALLNKEITRAEFEYLVNTDRDSFKMEALKQAGLVAIRVDQFRGSVLNLIVDTVFHLIPL